MMNSGFELIDSPDGYSLKISMPPSLRGLVEADILCRGNLLDGSAGNPREIGRRIKSRLGGNSLISPIQVHGTAIHQARNIWALPNRMRADGIHLDARFGTGITASLRYGDCAPVIIASVYPRPWAVILHSGFRGTLQNIVGSGIARAISCYGRINPSETYAWIGPAIGPCCYTRKRSDPSSSKALSVLGETFCADSGENISIDIPGAIFGQLRSAGIPEENIKSLSMCTCCNSRYFYSYRGGDEEDRMILLAKTAKIDD